MAKVEINVHSDLAEEAGPIDEALKLVADAIEGYYAYKMGCVDLNEKNYLAMLWASNHLSGLIAQTRPAIYPFNSKQQDSKKHHLIHHSSYLPHNPYIKD